MTINSVGSSILGSVLPSGGSSRVDNDGDKDGGRTQGGAAAADSCSVRWRRP
jgi:hypothetical protein